MTIITIQAKDNHKEDTKRKSKHILMIYMIKLVHKKIEINNTKRTIIMIKNVPIILSILYNQDNNKITNMKIITSTATKTIPKKSKAEEIKRKVSFISCRFLISQKTRKGNPDIKMKIVIKYTLLNQNMLKNKILS